MDLTRRELVKRCALTGVALLAGRNVAAARGLGGPVPAPSRPATPPLQTPLLTRPIPSTGERLPVIGLGSAGTFGGEGSDGRLEPLREVLRRFHDAGGRFFDTAPTYGDAEAVSGALAGELGIRDDIFFASKVSTPLIDTNPALAEWSLQEAAAQRAGSREAWDREVVDLQQIHNLYGLDTHLPELLQAKEEGRIRYVGVTVQAASQYPDLERAMRSGRLDFVQVNFSLAEREAQERILPLAHDLGLAVVVNEPFNGGAIFQAVRGRDLPEWSAEIGAGSWARFFLKYIVSHPAVTVTIPATSDPEHLVDNMGAGVGPLPDEAQRRRMETLLD